MAYHCQDICSDNGDHYNVIMSAMASQITSLMIVYSTVYSKRRSKKTSRLRVAGLCDGNSPVTGEFLAQRASKAENVSIWWRHHATLWSLNNGKVNHSDRTIYSPVKENCGGGGVAFLSTPTEIYPQAFKDALVWRSSNHQSACR